MTVNALVKTIGIVVAAFLIRRDVWFSPTAVGLSFAVWALVALWSTRGRPVSRTRVAFAATVLLLGLVGDLRIASLVGAAGLAAAGARAVPWCVLLAATAAWLPQSDVLSAYVAVPPYAFRSLGLAALFVPLLRLPARSNERSESRSFRFAAPVGLAGFVAVLAIAAYAPTPAEVCLLDRLPKTGLLVRGADLPLSEQEAAHFAAVDVLKRRYRVPAGEFDLLAVDGRADRHAVHDPAYCHLGDGWEVVDRQELPLPGGEAAWVAYGRAGERTEAVFWFTDGSSRTASAGRYWWWATRRRLTAGRSGPEPVLVVLQPSGEAPPNWADALRQFPALAEM